MSNDTVPVENVGYRDPLTGEYVIKPVEQAPAIAPASAQEAPQGVPVAQSLPLIPASPPVPIVQPIQPATLQGTRSRFRSRSGPQTYSSTVQLGEGDDALIVNIEELTKPQMEYYSSETAAIQQGYASLKEPTFPKEKKSALAEELASRQEALHLWVVQTAVRGGNDELLHTSEGLADMYPSSLAELSDLIVQKSKLGKAASDFLDK